MRRDAQKDPADFSDAFCAKTLINQVAIKAQCIFLMMQMDKRILDNITASFQLNCYF